MNLTVTLVPHGAVYTVYPILIDYIKKAEEWTLGRMNIDDISALMFSRNAQLWMVFDQESGDVHGYLTTEIRQYPQAKHLCVLNCGGHDGSLDACVHKVFDIFEQYAKSTGCDGIEFAGRPAWSKFVKQHDIQKTYVQFFKSLRSES